MSEKVRAEDCNPESPDGPLSLLWVVPWGQPQKLVQWSHQSEGLECTRACDDVCVTLL